MDRRNVSYRWVEGRWVGVGYRVKVGTHKEN